MIVTSYPAPLVYMGNIGANFVPRFVLPMLCYIGGSSSNQRAPRSFGLIFPLLSLSAPQRERKKKKNPSTEAGSSSWPTSLSGSVQKRRRVKAQLRANGGMAAAAQRDALFGGRAKIKPIKDAPSPVTPLSQLALRRRRGSLPKATKGSAAVGARHIFHPLRFN